MRREAMWAAGPGMAICVCCAGVRSETWLEEQKESRRNTRASAWGSIATEQTLSVGKGCTSHAKEGPPLGDEDMEARRHKGRFLGVKSI